MARRFFGTWYKWGGDDPSGLDCSGYVVECLKSVGLMRIHEDATADGLYRRFKRFEVRRPQTGALVFWFRNGHAFHVAICVDDQFCLTADSGGPGVETQEDAVVENAFIKLRPIAGHRRADDVKFVYLFALE